MYYSSFVINSEKKRIRTVFSMQRASVILEQVCCVLADNLGQCLRMLHGSIITAYIIPLLEETLLCNMKGSTGSGSIIEAFAPAD